MKVKDEIIIHPERHKSEKAIPSHGLFLVNPTESKVVMTMMQAAGAKRRFLFHSELMVSKNEDFFVAGPAIGAPMAVMTFEKLIALGAQQIVLFGWCGAISPEFSIGDILLGGEAYSGEGTSRYYTRDLSSSPTQFLVEQLQSLFAGTRPQAMWSTDAVFRESRPMLQELADKYNVCGVDMEYSALCAVAAFRNIDFAGLFLVSDELWQPEWRPGFTTKDFKKKSRESIELLLANIPFINTAEKG